MLRYIGDYDFGGHTATRVIATSEILDVASGYQFNLTVRRRVAREDGDEHLFDFHTVIVRSDGGVDEKLAEIAARSYSLEDVPNSVASTALKNLGSLSVDTAFQSAKGFLEERIKIWDWDEEVDLIGVAKVAFVAPASSKS
jgi:hypothetical protein